MKVYLLNLDYFYENIEQNEYYTEVYSSLEKAVEDGKYFLNRRYNDKGFRDYEFKVTEIDLEYAEEFSKEKLNIFDREELGKYEPTHIVYYFSINGELLYKHLKYKDKQRKYLKGFTMYLEDFEENAGQKFKIGDIVTIKKRNEDEYYSLEYLDYWTEDKLYIVRELPKKAKDQKYFNNTYSLISTYNEDEFMKGLFTFRHYEKDIEKYDVNMDGNSPIGFLQKIIKNEIAVTSETWTKLKTGQILLEQDCYKSLPEFKEGENWSFYCNLLSKKDTRLPADIYIGFGVFYELIKDYLPKLRVHTTEDFGQDFYISISDTPKIVIGENTILAEDELKQIYEYIIEHLEILLEYWNSEGKIDGRDLYIKLGLYDKEN